MKNPKRIRLSAVLTATFDGPVPVADQRSHIAQWAKHAPKTIVMGPHRPAMANGLRWFPCASNGPLVELIESYLSSLPRGEVCLIGTPDTDIGGDFTGLFELAGEGAWAAVVNYAGGRMFIIPSGVVASMAPYIPSSVRLGDKSWEGWMNAWLTAHLPPSRYIDASPFHIVPEPENPPIMNAYSIQFNNDGQQSCASSGDQTQSRTEGSLVHRGRGKKVKGCPAGGAGTEAGSSDRPGPGPAAVG